MEVNKITWKQDGDKWTGWNNDIQLLGWVYDTSTDQWYFCKEDNVVLGWQQVDKDERWYYFLPQQTIINNKVYYKGQMFDGGWMQYKNKWVYCMPKSESYNAQYRGQALCNCSKTINGTTYSFDENCYWIESLISDELIDFVKSYEGFSATKYKDCVGVLTQGYGLTGEYITNLPNSITEEKATEILKQVLNDDYAKVIKADLDKRGITLKQQEFDALCSMAYNVGTGGVLGSTLYKNICNGIRDSRLKDNFTAWSKAGGKTIQGLYNRRLEEYNMFIYGDYKRDL